MTRMSRNRQRDRARVIIAGGGFAGLACANALDHRHFDVTLIDRRKAFEFTPNIHEIVSGVKRAKDVRLDYREALAARQHRFIRGDVSSIDPEERTVRVGRRTLRADNLVLTFGAVDATYGIEGVEKHTLPFKDAEHTTAIHRALEQALRAGEQPKVWVIGAGLAGVEAVGEVLRSYRGDFGSLGLIEARAALLPALTSSVGKHVVSLCGEQDVECVTGDPVARITAKTIVLKSGRRLRSDITIWTGGPAAPPLLEESGLAPVRGWCPVEDSLEHVDFPGIFAAGDIAQPPSLPTKQAYHALDMGRHVALNLERSRKGLKLKGYRPVGKPTLMSFGDLDTVLVAGDYAAAGPALAAGKEAVFAATMAQLDQRAIGRQLRAMLLRGQRASEALLWPSLRSIDTLKRQASVKIL